MSDEEIEFMGSKPAVPPTLQRPVTGIVLHVEKNGTDDGYRMSFNRSSSSVIHVGRRPGVESESRTRDVDSGRAMFRCAVVSRKHAKIAFSDSGHVYLIDLSSHHGTHVRKPGELFSKPLMSEVPSPLSDGDVVTFGKTVGRHEECVRPVVVRVELMRNPQPIKPLVVPSAPSDKSSPASSRLSSGRYGIYSSYSSDERPSTPSLDNDSDAERAVAPPIRSCSLSKHESIPSSGIGRAFDMLKRLIPPSHAPNSGNEGAGGDGPALTLAPIAMQSDPSPPTLPPLQDAVSFNAKRDTPAYKSRSNSPMDLESPSPGPAPMLSLASDVTGKLSVSPEASQRSSPEANASEDDDESSSDGRGGSESPSNLDESEVDETSQMSSRGVTAAITGAADASSEAAQPELQELKNTLEKLQTDVTKLDTHRRKYRTRFNNNVHRLAEKLGHYDDRLAEVNAQYDNLAEKVETISRIEIADIACQLEDMNEQVENLAYVDIADLQTRVDGLDDDVGGILRKGPGDETHVAENKVSQNEIKTLQELVIQMKALRATTEMQMTESLIEVKEMCKATMAHVTAEYNQTKLALAVAVAPNTDQLSPTSFKRKREDNNDGADASIDMDSTMDTTMDTTLSDSDYSTCTPDVEMHTNRISFPISATAMIPSQASSHTSGDDDSRRPKKRLRTIAKVVAHTATAVTIGAVATWSALAFA